jgi:glycosyltransferase involved in cell wall biosynthesis
LPEPLPISIVVPHMNQPGALASCLESLAPHLLRKDEIVVVDNGSRELPVDICERYAFVKLITESIPGPGPARNCGVAATRHEILAFIDADCVAHPRWIQAVRNFFSEHPDAKVIGGDVRIGMVDTRKPTMLEAYESVFAYRQKEYIERMHFSGTGNLAMRRDAFNLVGGFAGIGVAEDRDWGRRAYEKQLTIAYLDDMIVYHPARKSFGELTHKWDRHISHQFNDLSLAGGSKVGWLVRTIAVAASGIIDVRKIIFSNRIDGVATRFRASIILFRIRIYRASQMLRLLFAKPGSVRATWNSE